eukprot:scaffold152_cov128-Cylindrotheca_fusiformis.AAC.2
MVMRTSMRRAAFGTRADPTIGELSKLKHNSWLGMRTHIRQGRRGAEKVPNSSLDSDPKTVKHVKKMHSIGQCMTRT